MVTHLIELGLYKPSGLLIRHPLQDLKVHGPNLDTDKNYQLINVQSVGIGMNNFAVMENEVEQSGCIYEVVYLSSKMKLNNVNNTTNDVTLHINK